MTAGLKNTPRASARLTFPHALLIVAVAAASPALAMLPGFVWRGLLGNEQQANVQLTSCILALVPAAALVVLAARFLWKDRSWLAAVLLVVAIAWFGLFLGLLDIWLLVVQRAAEHGWREF